MKTIYSLLIVFLIALTTYGQETKQKHYLQELIDKYKMMEPDSVVADMLGLTKKCGQADFEQFENDILNSITKEDSLYIKHAFKDTVNLRKEVKQDITNFYNKEGQEIIGYFDYKSKGYMYRRFQIKRNEKLIYKLNWGLKGNIKKEETYYYKNSNRKKLHIRWVGDGSEYPYQTYKSEYYSNKSNRYSKKTYFIYENRSATNRDRYSQSKPVAVNQHTGKEYPSEFIKQPEIKEYNTSMFLVSFNTARELIGLDFFNYRKYCNQNKN
ncbi:hypothetical protein U6A24_13665 [Aquimarina gracilis]|uniref:MORN repeat protein n=1 Tax=Aquimarina gracilis TaxID=874422 RepID=A0ABU5ZXD4_9FLAO|nr:hypothetical protein [Aquimarina gracilis]MEB3346520.1 hypothetical protein [Aquimarina gracilis]